MDTEFEKQLVKALELISITANQAWWHNQGQHCGADLDMKNCSDCFAFEQCQRNEKLIKLFEDLPPAVG